MIGKTLNGTFRKIKPVEIDEKGKRVKENIEILKIMFQGKTNDEMKLNIMENIKKW